MDGINHAFEFLMASFSKVVKAGQTGITQTYLFVFGVGIMIIIMLAFAIEVDYCRMVDFSTPLLVTVVLGSVGLGIPVIDALKKERGSNNKLYSAIAFSALILAIGIVIFRVLTGQVMPAAHLGQVSFQMIFLVHFLQFHC